MKYGDDRKSFGIEKGMRKLVKEVYGGRCAYCNGKAEHIHHIDHDHSNNVIENLIPLCAEHHAAEHPGHAAKILI